MGPEPSQPAPYQPAPYGLALLTGQAVSLLDEHDLEGLAATEAQFVRDLPGQASEKPLASERGERDEGGGDAVCGGASGDD